MKTFCSILFRFALFFVGVGLLSRLGSAQEVARPAAAVPVVNLAVVAAPSSSFVSGDTTVTALNDNYSPRNSRDNRRGSYGNWPRTGTQWVQYEWSQPISTKQMDVYWWADGQGVGVCRRRAGCYIGTATNFVPVTNASRLGRRREINFNTTTFDEVHDDQAAAGDGFGRQLSTGILEWKVYDSGKSPDFPPTVRGGRGSRCDAGRQDIFVRRGEIAARRTASAKTEWSKESGPGEVTFADAGALETTATFSKPGDYVLKLTARRRRAEFQSSTLESEGGRRRRRRTGWMWFTRRITASTARCGTRARRR